MEDECKCGLDCLPCEECGKPWCECICENEPEDENDDNEDW